MAGTHRLPSTREYCRISLVFGLWFFFLPTEENRIARPGNTPSTRVSLHKDTNKRLTKPATRYFSSSSASSASNPTRKALDQLFDKYRTNPKDSPNELDFQGAGELLEDLEIPLDDVGALVFFELTKSPQIGVIDREGFAGSAALLDAHADSVPKIRNYVLARRAELGRDWELLKRVYNHSFTLLIEERKKAIDLEQAEGFWRVLFADDVWPWATPRTPWLEWYLDFLKNKWGKAVNRDLWRQTLVFAQKSKEDESLGFWSEDSSWPSVIDDFVEWVKTEKRGGEAMEE